MHNTYILGGQILYDGIKASVRGGFDLTTRLIDEAQISARVKAFEQLFAAAVEYTCDRGPPLSVPDQLDGLTSWNVSAVRTLQSATVKAVAQMARTA